MTGVKLAGAVLAGAIGAACFYMLLLLLVQGTLA